MVNTKLILVLAAIIFFNSCVNKKYKSSLERDNIKGEVSFIEESTYKAYDNFGNIRKGSLQMKHTFKYDKDGNLDEEVYYDSDGSQLFKYIYKYEENSNIVNENVYNSDGQLVFKHLYYYDENGNQKESESFNSGGQLTGKFKFKYNAEGQKIESSFYNSDGNLEITYSYKYDNNGTVKIQNISPFGASMLQKCSYKFFYEKSPNWIKNVRYDNGVIPTEITVRKIEYYK